MSMQASDETLIARIAAGDRVAMEAFYGRHHVRVFRFVVRLVARRDVAEDVLSEAFLEVWRLAGRFEGRSSATTWLMAIARNKALTEMRRRPMEPLDEARAETIPDLGDDPEQALQTKGRDRILRHCLSALSPEHREIIDLVYYHEKSVREVSEIVGIPENTVKTRMFYARKHLNALVTSAGLDLGER
ncbi:MAG: sigma-70 family RNA polymerase sigma factor [Methylobacteriaceae bacterium]|nr:sigma-70 family RNA polymerase sigma factor [Methylobacteriaceae bacterium]